MTVNAPAADIVSATRAAWTSIAAVYTDYKLPPSIYSNLLSNPATDILVFVNGVKQTAFSWSTNDLTWTLGSEPAIGSQVEMVRNSLMDTGNASQLKFVLQETLDAVMWMNGVNALSVPFLTNNESLPVWEILPTGALAPTGSINSGQQLLNPGGFNKGQLRYQTLLPSSVPYNSRALASFQTILDSPHSTLTLVGASQDPNGTLIFTSVSTGLYFIGVVINPPGTAGISVTNNIITVTPATGSSTANAVAAQIAAYGPAAALVTVAVGGTGAGQVGTYNDPMDIQYLSAGGKNTYSGFSVNQLSYIQDPIYPQSNTALNVVAQNALGVSYGKAEALVVSALAAPGGQGIATLTNAATPTPTVITFQAFIGPDSANYNIKTGTSSGAGSVVVSGTSPNLHIVITPPASSTASTIVTLFNNYTSAPGSNLAGFGASFTGPDVSFDNIGPSRFSAGQFSNGKLVGVQSIIAPQQDPGGNFPPVQETFSYTANSAGEFPGYGAFIAKSRDDNSDAGTQTGWYNGFIVDDGHPATNAIKYRAFWYYDHFVVTARDSIIPKGGGTFTYRTGIWMGVGTDTPTAPFHLAIPAPPNGSYPNTNPDIWLEGNRAISDAEAIATITVTSPGATTGVGPKQRAYIQAYMDATAGANSEVCSFQFATSKLTGTYAAPSVTWHLGQGFYADGATGTDTGVNTINVGHGAVGGYYFAGVRVVNSQKTGWTAPTGTLNRATAINGTWSQTIGASYSQTQVAALETQIELLTKTLAALLTDLRSHGLIAT